MNDLVIMERQNIVDIADAIRNKTGVNDQMTLERMITSINEIGGDSPKDMPAIGVIVTDKIANQILSDRGLGAEIIVEDTTE